MGRNSEAIRWYTKAAKHARRIKDHFLVSRTLGNLAQLKVDEDPAEAIDLSRKSIRAKRAINDTVGLAGQYEILAVAFAKLGDLRRAIRAYRRADKLAAAMDLRYLRALTLGNLGRTLVDAGRLRAAIQSLQRSRSISEEEGFADLLRSSLLSEGMAQFKLGDLRQAEQCFAKLKDVSTAAGDEANLICSHHSLGLIGKLDNKPSEAERHLVAAMRFARAAREWDWFLRAVRDRSRIGSRGELGSPDADKLCKAAHIEELRPRNAFAAALVWREAARQLRIETSSKRRPGECYERALKLLKKAKDSEKLQAEMIGEFYEHLWEVGQFQESLKTLKRLERLATQHDLTEQQVSAMGQRTESLTELERYDEATPIYRTAIRIAQIRS